MREKIVFLLLFLLEITADQLSKAAVNSLYSLNVSHQFIGNILKLTYIRNSGVAFGLFQNNPRLLFFINLSVIVILVYLFLAEKLDLRTRLSKGAMVMVIGGAIGNLIDRIRMGEVIDFIDMGIGPYRWPTYNVADIFITCGLIILIIIYTLTPHSTEQDAPPSHT